MYEFEPKLSKTREHEVRLTVSYDDRTFHRAFSIIVGLFQHGRSLSIAASNSFVDCPSFRRPSKHQDVHLLADIQHRMQTQPQRDHP